ncbi:unnamed protein product (macronuclear) [Paramecium tetraurelia]|uniref:Uncharacterized protein n=1 Tax=Paramecium tetraurelia TaxID=5888 RepID=A0CWH6_PARTE|nr:uncharacterized protein GSPATT00001346001 [Paramecium tetraurelia]CAK75143.1 unnamed protein product [Paramecium tetraurelia]|eukprot:XP_001442540.1 hypothetical protein (macronuclear) [Paramecium tetraurelia strain d4-2]
MSDKLEYNNQLVQYGFQGKQFPVSIKAKQLSNYPLVMASLLVITIKLQKQKQFPRKIQLQSPLNRKISNHSFKKSLSIKRISTPKRKNPTYEDALFITLKPLTFNQINDSRAQTAHQFRPEQDSLKDTGKLWSCQSKRASHFFRSRNRSAHCNQNQQQFKITRNGRVEFL